MTELFAALTTSLFIGAGVRCWADTARAGARSRLGTVDPGPPARFVRWWAGRGLPRPDLGWIAVATTAGAVGVVGVATPLFACLIAAAVVVAGAVAERLWHANRARVRRTQLAPALDTIASSLRAGRSMTVAIDDAKGVGAPLGDELAAIAAAATKGASVHDVVARWAADADPDTRAMAAAVALGAEVGGPVARAVDAAAASLREQQSLQREAIALATQARASAAVLSISPLAFAVILSGADGTTLSFFTDSLLGFVCLAAGLGLDAVGAWWMHRLVRNAVDAPSGATRPPSVSLRSA